MSPPFRLEPLANHNRAGFDCGQPDLNRYFQSQVTPDIRRRITNCFLAIETSTGLIAGFYTLAAASIATPDLPLDLTKHLPRYPSLPAVRIGRLAVDQRFQRRGLGAALLADAVSRTLQAPPAAYTLLVDAKDDRAVAFYRHHGFLSLVSQPRTLLLPLATAASLFQQTSSRRQAGQLNSRSAALQRAEHAEKRSPMESARLWSRTNAQLRCGD